MPRFAKKGSTRQDIFNIIRADLEKAGEAEGLFDEDIFTMKDTSRAKSIRGDIVREWLSNCVAYSDMNKTLQKDLAKVSFDWENAEEAWSEELLDHLPDGTALLWCYAGGDWEIPVHFVIYIDPSNKLRAYIPSEGNTYCHHCKTAWGSCECEKGEEEENAWQEAHGDEERLPDFPKVYADACERIQIKGEEGAKKPATPKKVYSLVHSARRIYQFKQHDTVAEAEDDVKRKLLSMTEDGDPEYIEKGNRNGYLPDNVIACWRTMSADLDEDNDPFWVDEGCSELYGIVFETDKQFIKVGFGMGGGDSDAADVEFFDDYAKACKKMRKEYDESLKEMEDLIKEDDDDEFGSRWDLKHGEEDNCCMMSCDDGCGGVTEVVAVLDVTKIDEYGA